MEDQNRHKPWQTLIESVKRHEGLRLAPYQDRARKLAESVRTG